MMKYFIVLLMLLIFSGCTQEQVTMQVKNENPEKPRIKIYYTPNDSTVDTFKFSIREFLEFPTLKDTLYGIPPYCTGIDSEFTFLPKDLRQEWIESTPNWDNLILTDKLESLIKFLEQKKKELYKEIYHRNESLI